MNGIEKKEIEEMARTNCGRTFISCYDCVEVSKKILSNVKLKDCECYCFAKALYNAGYGKVEDYRKEIERLKGQVARLKRYDEERDIALHSRLTREAKQQGIKVFAEKLKDKYWADRPITPNVIDDLLKEYGAEQ